jgi:hypothetical protein
MAIVANSGGALSIPQQLSMLLDWQHAQGSAKTRKADSRREPCASAALDRRQVQVVSQSREKTRRFGGDSLQGGSVGETLTPISVETTAIGGEQPLGLHGFAIGP